jgi:hypothetical protein
MKFFAALAFVLPVVSALAPTATTGKREFLSLNPDPASLPGVTSKRDFLSLNPDPASLSSLHISEPPAARRQTNADRLRRGLNPLSPRNLRRKGTTSHGEMLWQAGVPYMYTNDFIKPITLVSRRVSPLRKFVRYRVRPLRS